MGQIKKMLDTSLFFNDVTKILRADLEFISEVDFNIPSINLVIQEADGSWEYNKQLPEQMMTRSKITTRPQCVKHSHILRPYNYKMTIILTW